MPASLPFPVAGVIRDSSDNLKSGVNISLKNISTGEWIEESGTVISNSSGEYIIDAANLPSGYTNGDDLMVVYFLGNLRREAFTVIDTTVGSWINNETMYIITDFNRVCIDREVEQFGVHFILIDISKSYSGRRTYAESETKYVIKGIITEMDGTEDSVKEGKLNKEDLLIFIDSNETNTSYLKTGNKIEWDNKTYKIDNVINNPGHIEIFAQKT